MKEPKDLGVKIGSKDMAFWKGIIKAREIDIESSEGNLKYFKAILELAKFKYKMAEEDWKEGKK